jgi:RNA 2',3'-cyclic 3'-phosphodiesterase
MPEQVAQPEPESGSPATDGLFFAVFPDSNAAEKIAHLADDVRADYRLKGKPFATSRFHVTLHHLGNHAGLPREIVERASAAAGAVAMTCFDVTFDRVLSFRGKAHNRPYVLVGDEGVGALRELQRVLGVALREYGLEVGMRSSFTPHVTLLYGNDNIPAYPVEGIGWRVHEFVLVHSLLGRTRHIPLGRWPFLP